MENAAPTWINKEFLTQCLLKEEGKQNVIVTNFSTSSAAPPGSNYGSCVIRVKVEYQENKDDDKLHYLSLVIKSEVTEGVAKEMTQEMGVVEPVFYNKYLPEAKKLTNISFCPRNFFSPRSNTVVLEDLKEQGYLMADKVKMLDFDHCRLYVLAAATFHAVSFAVHKENPELVESMGKEKIFSNELNHANKFKFLTKIATQCLADGAEKIEQFSKYSETIRDSSDHIWDLIVEAHKPSKVLNTISQGDPWTTNMMFKYDDSGRVCQVKLLDFQALSYNSPVNDLVIFVWYSANHDVKRYRLEELYKIYLDSFNQKLEELHCTERLTYEHLKDNVKMLHPLAIYSAACTPLILNEKPIDIESLYNDNEEIAEKCFKIYFNESFCKTHLSKLLEALEVAGVFEYLKCCKK